MQKLIFFFTYKSKHWQSIVRSIISFSLLYIYINGIFFVQDHLGQCIIYSILYHIREPQGKSRWNFFFFFRKTFLKFNTFSTNLIFLCYNFKFFEYTRIKSSKKSRKVIDAHRIQIVSKSPRSKYKRALLLLLGARSVRILNVRLYIGHCGTAGR